MSSPVRAPLNIVKSSAPLLCPAGHSAIERNSGSDSKANAATRLAWRMTGSNLSSSLRSPPLLLRTLAREQFSISVRAVYEVSNLDLRRVRQRLLLLEQ